MTAVGYIIENIVCLEGEAMMKQASELYKKINASYFSGHTIVPLQFGNIVDNEEEVRQTAVEGRATAIY